MSIQYQDLSKFELPRGFRSRPAWFVQLWWLVQSTLFACSPQFMYGWRRFLLRMFGAAIGTGVLIRPSAKVTYPWKVKIGDWSWIGDEVVLYSLGPVNIGNHVVVSQRSYLCAASHDPAKEAFDIFESAVNVHDQAWLAADVFVGPGRTIGRGAVVGARSSVFRDLPEGMVCLGNPAVPVRSRLARKAIIEKQEECASSYIA
jgi:putative colanic acid biosynthesis acetyltransferase WcaF